MTNCLRNLTIAILALVATTLPAASESVAAEIRLIDRVTIEPGIVQLGDIAELYGAPLAVTDRLAAIELFPAPSAKRETIVSGRRIMDVLVRRGINFNEHRVSGASRVTLVPAAKPTSNKPITVRKKVRLDHQEIAASKEVVEASIVEHLSRKVSAASDEDVDNWQFDFKLSIQQASWIHQANNRFTVTGGIAPYSGRQRFDIVAVAAEEEVRRFAINVNIKQPRLVVVAQQDLPRGTVILESDVRLEEVTDARVSRGAATTLAEVVGKESTGTIRAGKPIATRSLREPVLVKRGEQVTVVALAGGIRVETQGTARQDGSLNQLIVIQTNDKRRTQYQARVSNIQEVEVYAGAVATR